MCRFIFFVLAAFVLAGAGASSTFAQQKDKKDLPKDPLNETFGGKTIGEWIKLLRTAENPRHRMAALIALNAGDAAGKTALPAVLDALEKDKDAQVRQRAAMVLAELGPKTKGSLKALVAALQTDKDADVREAAATALGNTKFKDVASEYITAIADALKDPHPGTRVAAAAALRNMGESAKPAAGALIDAAKNPKEHALVRAAAVHVVSRYAKDNPQTVPLLLDILKSSDASFALREAAAEGLGRTGGDSPEAVALLSQTLAEKNVDLRKAAAVALGTLGDKAKAAWPTVKVHLKNPDEESGVRNHLIRFAGTLAKGNPEAIKTLTDVAIEDKSTENRIAAIQEMGELGSLPKEARDALKSIAARDARAVIREAAEKALKRVGG